MRNAVTELLKQPLEVIDVEQNSAEWFRIRRTKRTASETPIVLGLSPWATASTLALEKFSSKPAEALSNVATRHGHKWEPIARSLYEHRFDVIMTPSVIVRGDYMSSLDGWNRKQRTILEIKCPYMSNQSETWIKACDDEIPDHYYAQIQHQLMVSGAESCSFWVFDSTRRKGIHITVKPDKSYYVRILTAWDAFIKKYA